MAIGWVEFWTEVIQRGDLIMDMMQIGRSYAVGWGALALINAGLAESKGRSRMAWFLVSVVLGPLATFLIVVTDRTTPL